MPKGPDGKYLKKAITSETYIFSVKFKLTEVNSKAFQ